MIINGNKMSVKSKSVIELLAYLKVSLHMVVVEVNGNILDKRSFDDQILNDDDKIEIVSFVGGG